MTATTKSALGVLGLYTETPLHCGAESATGYVDLPIQRERHSHYPLIPGSTLKGILRDETAHHGLDADEVRAVFGSDVQADETTPGSVTFGDGVVAAFPVRSSGAPFHWVTCPFVLERVARALSRPLPAVSVPDKGQAWGAEDGLVVLEEIRLDVKARDDVFADGPGSPLGLLLSLLPAAERGFAHTREIFPRRLLVLRDDDFGELMDIGTEVLTRIKLNELKTTRTIEKEEAKELGITDREGNMFVQEVVPPETLFLAPLRAGGAQDRLTEVLGSLPVIRVGGDETIGRGVTHLTWVGTKGEG